MNTIIIKTRKTVQRHQEKTFLGLRPIRATIHTKNTPSGCIIKTFQPWKRNYGQVPPVRNFIFSQPEVAIDINGAVLKH
ncbi:hypothetical protein PVAP13_2NG558403 [Panicum virgatum]|uniref:Uncharacterized protein n=1 Tax=Panicum virgatum TaxID=38727 RepID=A0A8T0VP68_PANVG|nr:hypothetical protein PVAP13_2NG558403 [Panicum virgatum]